MGCVTSCYASSCWSVNTELSGEKKEEVNVSHDIWGGEGATEGAKWEHGGGQSVDHCGNVVGNVMYLCLYSSR
jgi:hypothetical protein